MRFRDKFARFMYGRNGFDRTCNLLLWTGLILVVLNMFLHSFVLNIIYYVILIYCMFRILSRNIYKRRTEDQKVMAVWGRIKNFFLLLKNKFRDRKTHIYRTCPECKANLRLPKRKGKHTVRCPKCSNRFEIVSK